MEFEIPCPSTAVDSGLWISTENNELTVGFHTDHCHFTDYECPQNLAVIHQGLDFVVEILKDRRGILSWYHGDQLVHTTTIQLPHSGPLPCLLSNCTRVRCVVGQASSTKTRAALRSADSMVFRFSKTKNWEGKRNSLPRFFFWSMLLPPPRGPRFSYRVLPRSVAFDPSGYRPFIKVFSEKSKLKRLPHRLVFEPSPIPRLLQASWPIR